MNEYTNELHKIGWTLKSLAEHSGIPLRNLSRVAKNPNWFHWQAIRTLPIKDPHTPPWWIHPDIVRML